MANKAINYLIKVAVQGDKQLQQLQRSTDRMTRAAQKNARAMDKMNKRMAAVGRYAKAGAAGIASMIGTQQINASLKYADAIGKTADKLGISVESLQKYRFAAQQTGVAQNALDMGLQRFSRRVGEAANGSGVLKDVFNDLGIALRDSNGRLRQTEDILNDYADAIAGAGSSQEKLLLAFKAFDSEGAALVNTVGKGSEAFKELQRQAVEAGVVLEGSLVRSPTALLSPSGPMRRLIEYSAPWSPRLR